MRYIAALAAALAVAGTALASNDSPKAFDRPARPGDAIGSALGELPARIGNIVMSRRVATYDGGPHRRGRLYLVRTSRRWTCVFFVWRGTGGGCSPGPLFAVRRVSANAGQFLSGIAADEVTRVVVVGSRGVRHRVPLSPDKGFIYDCRAYNGCTCAVAWLDAYAGERRVAHQDWLGTDCRKRR
jgi:hypothetical protein